MAKGIGEFIKQCCFPSDDYELIGIAESVINKANNFIQQENEMWEKYDEWRAQENYEMVKEKPFYSATDLTELLNLENAVKTNKFLESIGYQTRENNGWVATKKAEGLCKQEGLETGEKPYVRWLPKFLPILEQEIENAA